MEGTQDFAPIDPSLPFAARVELIRAHWDRVLKFDHPVVSDSGRWEATWMPDGNAIADTEEELIAIVRSAMQSD